ncbi:hypothetical protein GE061_012656 [Apolygus lucorum]|uniref:Reverse transcriptase Ty1/copia-type domain-containing protein n=1 Tax=Apolygus lucorum TaxID=248454 RepID=A0A8S9XWZ6_APOLU|nr:hypothetical protein GE061_012656 [Apolygus lucorum]
MLVKTKTKSKLDPRSRECIFVGYSDTSKAYRVWDVEKRKICVTRDLKFVDEMNRKTVKVEEFEGLKELEVDLRTVDGSERKNETEQQNKIEVRIKTTTRSSNKQRVETENIVQHENVESENSIPGREEGTEEMVRGRGRPKLVKITEGPGRRKKVYNMIPKIDNVTDCANSDNNQQELTDENSGETDDDTFEDAETGTCENACAAEVNPTEAFAGPESHEWYAAVRKEFSSLLRNKTWSLREKPQDQKAVGCRLILCNKYTASGELERRKARLVAKGFTQEPNVDYHETYSPVVRLSSLRTVMALAVKHGMVVEQMDVETAYLNGELEENIYMEPPKHFEQILMDIVENENDGEIMENAWKMLREFRGGKKYCKLQKSLYGLKQSGRQWYLKLDERLKAIGMIPSESDPCVYTWGKGEEAVILAVYVDDIVLASKDQEKLRILKQKMMDEFRMKDLGKIHYCLGLEFDYDFEKGKLKISQRKYINEILKKFKMETANPISTPLDVNVKFEPTEARPSEMDKYPFRSLIGSLMYLAIGTRPDVDYAVIYLSQFNSCYSEIHWKAAKRILRYLKGTMDRELVCSYFVDVEEAEDSCFIERRS